MILLNLLQCEVMIMQDR